MILTLGDERQSVPSIPKSLNPEWNESLEFRISGPQSLLLEVVCWDKDRWGKDYMGEFDVPLEDLFTNGTVTSDVSPSIEMLLRLKLTSHSLPGIVLSHVRLAKRKASSQEKYY